MDTKLVIFDLDGTLLDTIADLGTAVNYALEKGGYPTHPIEAYPKMVGHGVRKLMANAVPEGTPQDVIDALLVDQKAYYFSHIDVFTKPYPGIPDVLKALQDKGIKVAIASNKVQFGTDRLAEVYFPDIKWVATFGDSPEHPLKPDPACLQMIMDMAGASRENTTMVGDAGSDVEAARNAGVRAVAVSWGFRPMEDLQGADHIATDSTDLLNTLLS